MFQKSNETREIYNEGHNYRNNVHNNVIALTSQQYRDSYIKQINKRFSIGNKDILKLTQIVQCDDILC